jgi:hypothetical protein
MTENTDTRPNRFTGNWKGVQYYKGVVWGGPSNMIGYGTRPRARFVPKARAACDTRGPNMTPSNDLLVADRDGRFVLLPGTEHAAACLVSRS